METLLSHKKEPIWVSSDEVDEPRTYYTEWWTPGVGDGQGGLACRDLWGRKELQKVGHDWVTKLNWTEYSIVHMYHNFFIHSSVDI